jgi:hypothetical protein
MDPMFGYVMKQGAKTVHVWCDGYGGSGGRKPVSLTVCGLAIEGGLRYKKAPPDALAREGLKMCRRCKPDH